MTQKSLVNAPQLSSVYATGAGQACGGNQIIPFTTEMLDTKSEYSAGGVFTALHAGVYLFDAGVRTDSGTPSYSTYLRKNSTNLMRSLVSQTGVMSHIHGTFSLAVGETLDFYLEYSSGPTTLTASTNINYIRIQQVSFT